MQKKRLPYAAKAPYRKVPNQLSQVQQTRLKTLVGPMQYSDIALLVGVTPAMITYMFRGHRRPSIEIAGKLARVLHITVDDLMETIGLDWTGPVGGK